MKAQRDAHQPLAAIDVSRLYWVAAAFGGGLLVVLALGFVLWRVWLAPAATARIGVIPPAPRLQAQPSADLAAQRAQQQARLNGYAWVDRQAGIARIPIARAMELVAQQGVAGRPATAPPAAVAR